MDKVKLDKDQKLITLTEEKFREMEEEIKELRRHAAVVTLVTWTSGHYQSDTRSSFHVEDGDKVEDVLGSFWRQVKEQISTVQKQNDLSNKRWRDAERNQQLSEERIKNALDQQRFVPNWIVWLFGRRKKNVS